MGASRIPSQTEAAALIARLIQICGTRTASQVPTSAQPAWIELTRLLKARADRPIPADALAVVSAWPAARFSRLAELLDTISDAIDGAANDKANDDIRTWVARTYL